MAKRFTGPQIVAKLRQADVLIGQGKNVPDVCREIEVSQQTYYRWRQKYGDMSPEMILQHTFGIPGRLDAFLSVREKIGARVIEDCAHSLGCSWNGKPLGTFGEGAIYSFQWGKPYTTGQGGMCIPSAEVAQIKTFD